MRACLSVFRRELRGYFVTPIAAVFLVVFLLLAGFFTFNVGEFYKRGIADLRPFFNFHPWLFLFLMPAIAMRLWAEERRQGTIELLMTLPISTTAAVVGKFLAAWAFAAVALALTFPVWITVNYLGDPDNGVIVASYLGSLLMAGGFLAIGSCISAVTKNQVIAFVCCVAVSFVCFMLSGFPPVMVFFRQWAPEVLLDALAGFSFLNRFGAISKGVIDLRDLVFYGTLIGAFLWMNALIVDWKKAK